jgi:hypothetical protein
VTAGTGRPELQPTADHRRCHELSVSRCSFDAADKVKEVAELLAGPIPSTSLLSEQGDPSSSSAQTSSTGQPTPGYMQVPNLVAWLDNELSVVDFSRKSTADASHRETETRVRNSKQTIRDHKSFIAITEREHALSERVLPIVQTTAPRNRPTIH